MKLPYTLVLIILSFVNAYSVSGTIIKPGIYEGLMLAVDSEQRVIGYYKEVQGEGVSKTCSFFISGKANNRAINIVSWNNESFSGALDVEKDGVKLKIPEGQEHPGCGLVLSPQITEGMALDLVYKANWTDLRVVSPPRVYLHSEPADSKKMRSYLVKGDVVGVLSQRGDWLQVEYPGQKKTSKGWIKDKDTVKPVQPGQK